MKNDLKEIKPGYGLGILKFGMTRNDVKSMLGQPDTVDAYSYTENEEELTESWEYDDLGLSLSFDEEENWRLVMISVSSSFYELNNLKLIGEKHKLVAGELEKMNLGELKTEDCSSQEEPDCFLIEVESKSLNFWLDKGVLDEIQWSPEFVNDDTIKWPE